MNESTNSLRIQSAHQVPGIHDRLHEMVPWLRHADSPYFELLFAGRDGDAMTRRWLKRSDSELALQSTQVLIAEDRLAGGFIGFSGRQLGRRREADIIDLARQIGNPRCPRFRTQISDIYTLTSPVARDSYYLSKLGILPEIDAHPLRQFLLESCIERARHIGFKHLRFDVDEANTVLSRLFADNGFEVIARRQARVSSIRYLNMHRAL